MGIASTAACLLVAAVSCYLYGHDVLSSVLSVADDPSMPEPGAVPRRSPQGLPYTELQHLVNADGQYLFCRYWEPAGPPRSVQLTVLGSPACSRKNQIKCCDPLAWCADHMAAFSRSHVTWWGPAGRDSADSCHNETTSASSELSSLLLKITHLCVAAGKVQQRLECMKRL